MAMGTSIMEKTDEVSVIDQVMDELISQELDNKRDSDHSLVNVKPDHVEGSKSSLVNIEDFIQYQPGAIENRASKNNIIPFPKDADKSKAQNSKDVKAHQNPSEKEKAQQSGKIKNLINFFQSPKPPTKKKATVAVPYPKLSENQEKKRVHLNQQHKQPFIYSTEDIRKDKDTLSSQISLKQIENLRIAGERINALETELERLRRDNEELIATGDVFIDQLDKIRLQNEDLKKINENRKNEHADEKNILEQALAHLKLQVQKMEIKNQELNKRLLSNVQKIGVRERELENRLELMKRDNQTLLREKNQYILDLKNQLDIVKREGDMQKKKFENNVLKLESYKNQSSRAARGIKMALNILKGGEFSIEDPVSGEKAS